MTTLQIEFTTEELYRLQQLAFEHGYETPEAYLKSLVQESPTKAELLDDIREGLRAIQRGDPMPTLEAMWAKLEQDDETAC